MSIIFGSFLMPFFRLRLKRATAAHQAGVTAESTTRLALALLQVDKCDEAYATITTGRKHFPGSTAVAKAYESIRVRYAKRLLKTTMHQLKHDGRIETSIRAADLLRTLGQSEKALAILERVLTLHGSNWAVLYALGQVYFNRFREIGHPADLHEALKQLRLAREQSPRNYRILFFFALVATTAQLFDEALDSVESILAIVPTDPKILALKRQIEANRESQGAGAAAGEPGLFAPGQSVPGVRSTASTSADAALPEHCIDALFEAAETVGVFVISDYGDILAARCKDTNLFDLSDCNESVVKMVEASRIDSDHIGIGKLRNCVISGADWQVAVKACDNISVVVFLEGVYPDNFLEQLLSRACVEA